jgi:hypothetical protein
VKKFGVCFALSFSFQFDFSKEVVQRSPSTVSAKRFLTILYQAAVPRKSLCNGTSYPINRKTGPKRLR